MLIYLGNIKYKYIQLWYTLQIGTVTVGTEKKMSNPAKTVGGEIIKPHFSA